MCQRALEHTAQECTAGFWIRAKRQIVYQFTIYNWSETLKWRFQHPKWSECLDKTCLAWHGMATSGFPQLRPSFVLSAGLTGGPKTSNHSWSLEGSWNAELEWTCLHTTHEATHVSRVGAFSSENRVQIASLHLAISKQTTITSTNPLWLMKAISLWVAIVQYHIKQTWWVAHKDRTLHRCGKDCPLHELRSSPTALLDLEPCKPYMDSAWYGWRMPNLSVLSYCPFRICPYHPLSLSKISYGLAGHWSSYCRHEIWYATTAHIHRWNVCRISKQEIRRPRPTARGSASGQRGCEHKKHPQQQQ